MNEHECPNITINAQNWALMTKNKHLCPTFEHCFYRCDFFSDRFEDHSRSRWCFNCFEFGDLFRRIVWIYRSFGDAHYHRSYSISGAGGRCRQCFYFGADASARGQTTQWIDTWTYWAYSWYGRTEHVAHQCIRELLLLPRYVKSLNDWS